ncbi:MAG TPA: YdcF family protein [Rhizobium sp.]|nr:YdcF family protein [Rhizobium sp.]
MFLFSKLFWIVAQPLSLAFLAGLFGTVCTALRRPRMALLFLGASLAILFVTLYTSAGTVALQRLEAHVQRPEQDPVQVSCMVVLGGAFETEVTTVRGGTDLNQAADRFVETLRLALKFPRSRILVSGGDGSFGGTYEGDAAAARRFFAQFGVSEDRLTSEATSRTTFENVINSGPLLADPAMRRCLLVTSAFHMPRSLALFHMAGIELTPWPTDYRTSGSATLRLDFTQPTLNAQQTATAMREWIGLLAYYLTGRTASALP